MFEGPHEKNKNKTKKKKRIKTVNKQPPKKHKYECSINAIP